MKTNIEEKACPTGGEKGTLEEQERDPSMINIKAKIGGTIEQRLELERQRTGMDIAAIVRIALDNYLRTFEYYEKEGLKTDENTAATELEP